jgi:proteasome lid subunit RPN8/RPN11
MDARAQIAAMRTMRQRDEELFAIYHSHPNAPATPSQKDLQQAAYPGVVYLIVSLRDCEVRAYYFDGEDFEPLALIEAG